MGLLDDILAQVAGGTQPARPDRTTTAGSMAPVLTALLPVVLAMLSDDGRTGSRSGGLGGLLGQVLGGGDGSRAGGLGAAGGLGGLLGQLEQAGFGDQVRSWVGTGGNEPISPSAIESVFGRGTLEQIAQRAGVSQSDAADGLSQLMPELVDRMTPNGQLPDGAAMLANVEALAKRFGFV